LCYFYFNAWALAAVTASGDRPIETFDAPAHQFLPQAGLSVRRFGSWSVTESKNLGGAFVMESSSVPPAYNLGYEIETADGALLSTAVWSASSDDQTTVFTPIYTNRPLDRWDWLFHLFTRILVFPEPARRFQSWVRALAVTRRRETPFSFKRQIHVSDSGVEIEDTLIAAAGAPAVSHLRNAIEVGTYSPSARFDRARTLFVPDWNSSEMAVRLVRDRKLIVRWKVPAPVDGVLMPSKAGGSANPSHIDNQHTG
jgi:hypothetical protein